MNTSVSAVGQRGKKDTLAAPECAGFETALTYLDRQTGGQTPDRCCFLLPLRRRQRDKARERERATVQQQRLSEQLHTK